MAELEGTIQEVASPFTFGARQVPVASLKLLGWRARFAKRLCDLVVASGLLMMALPLTLAVGLAIGMETTGPLIFSHTRLGRGHRRFRLWKFRSMVANADDVLAAHLEQNFEQRYEWLTTHKLKQDPRVTRVGRFLRRFSLDEVPQLWNVLKGDMSMVGPRPIVVAEVPKYGSLYALYSQVKPGLTGLWQVSGRNDTSYRQRTELDAAYIRSWSLGLDLLVLLKTIRVVLLGRGAY